MARQSLQAEHLPPRHVGRRYEHQLAGRQRPLTQTPRVGSAGYTTNTNRVQIGAYWDNSTQADFFDGRIDKVRVGSSHHPQHGAHVLDSDKHRHIYMELDGRTTTPSIPHARSRLPSLLIPPTNALSMRT